MVWNVHINLIDYIVPSLSGDTNVSWKSHIVWKMDVRTLKDDIIEIQVWGESPTLFGKVEVGHFINEMTHILNALKFWMNMWYFSHLCIDLDPMWLILLMTYQSGIEANGSIKGLTHCLESLPNKLVVRRRVPL